MPARTERRRAELKCADCGHEFSGYGLYKVHYVPESSVPTDVVFHRAISPCAICKSRRVGERDDPLFTNVR
jgi:hypothetical protein